MNPITQLLQGDNWQQTVVTFDPILGWQISKLGENLSFLIEEELALHLIKVLKQKASFKPNLPE